MSQTTTPSRWRKAVHLAGALLIASLISVVLDIPMPGQRRPPAPSADPPAPTSPTAQAPSPAPPSLMELAGLPPHLLATNDEPGARVSDPSPISNQDDAHPQKGFNPDDVRLARTRIATCASHFRGARIATDSDTLRFADCLANQPNSANPAITQIRERSADLLQRYSTRAIGIREMRATIQAGTGIPMDRIEHCPVDGNHSIPICD